MSDRQEDLAKQLAEIDNALTTVDTALVEVNKLSPMADGCVRNARHAARHHLREAYDALSVAREDLESYAIEIRLTEEESK